MIPESAARPRGRTRTRSPTAGKRKRVGTPERSIPSMSTPTFLDQCARSELYTCPAPTTQIWDWQMASPARTILELEPEATQESKERIVITGGASFGKGQPRMKYVPPFEPETVEEAQQQYEQEQRERLERLCVDRSSPRGRFLVAYARSPMHANAERQVRRKLSGAPRTDPLLLANMQTVTLLVNVAHNEALLQRILCANEPMQLEKLHDIVDSYRKDLKRKLRETPDDEVLKMDWILYEIIMRHIVDALSAHAGHGGRWGRYLKEERSALRPWKKLRYRGESPPPLHYVKRREPSPPPPPSYTREF